MSAEKTLAVEMLASAGAVTARSLVQGKAPRPATYVATVAVFVVLAASSAAIPATARLCTSIGALMVLGEFVAPNGPGKFLLQVLDQTEWAANQPATPATTAAGTDTLTSLASYVSSGGASGSSSSSSSGGATVIPPANPGSISSPADWAAAELSYMGDPINDSNVGFLVGWQNREGGNWGNTAAYNPINTTLGEPGSTPINSVGVQSYSSWAQGIQATAQTLMGSAYQSILAALKAGDASEVDTSGGMASALSTWSGGGYSQITPAPAGSYSLPAAGSSPAPGYTLD